MKNTVEPDTINRVLIGNRVLIKYLVT